MFELTINLVTVVCNLHKAFWWTRKIKEKQWWYYAIHFFIFIHIMCWESRVPTRQERAWCSSPLGCWRPHCRMRAFRTKVCEYWCEFLGFLATKSLSPSFAAEPSLLGPLWIGGIFPVSCVFHVKMNWFKWNSSKISAFQRGPYRVRLQYFMSTRMPL
jgi:hypothetical protein